MIEIDCPPLYCYCRITINGTAIVRFCVDTLGEAKRRASHMRRYYGPHWIEATHMKARRETA